MNGRCRFCFLLVINLVRNPVLKNHCKFGSFSQLAFYFNGAAHHLNILLDDRHFQSGSRNFSFRCVSFPGKGFKLPIRVIAEISDFPHTGSSLEMKQSISWLASLSKMSSTLMIPTCFVCRSCFSSHFQPGGLQSCPFGLFGLYRRNL